MSTDVTRNREKRRLEILIADSDAVTIAPVLGEMSGVDFTNEASIVARGTVLIMVGSGAEKDIAAE